MTTPQTAPPPCAARRPRAHLAPALLTLALSVLCAAGSAQLAPEPADDAGPAQDEPLTMGMVAKINGKALTGADLNYFARGMANVGGSVAPGFHQSMRRMLAERLLLADEAERLGLKLNEYEVGDYYEKFFGFKPPYAPIEEVGLPIERQKELVRTLIYAELYVLHRVGIATDHMHLIPADPLLSRMLDVTPRQKKEYYKAHPEQFVRPASVGFTVWPCEDMAQALRLLDQLEAGETPEEPRGLESRMAEADLAAELAFAPDAVSLLSEGEPGDLGGPYRVRTEAGSQALVMRVQEHFPEEVLGFTGEVQRNLERRIQAAQLELARAEALERLRRDARSVYWPNDLFDDPEEAEEPGAER